MAEIAERRVCASAVARPELVRWRRRGPRAAWHSPRRPERPRHAVPVPGGVRLRLAIAAGARGIHHGLLIAVAVGLDFLALRFALALALAFIVAEGKGRLLAAVLATAVVRRELGELLEIRLVASLAAVRGRDGRRAHPHASAVVSRPLGAVRHDEAAVEAREEIRRRDDEVRDEVEAVVARAAVVPRGMAQRARREARVDAEGGAQRGQGRREQEQPHLAAPAAGAELLDGAVAREQGREHDDGDGQEGEHGHVGAREQLHGAVGAADGGVEGEEGLDGDGDDHEQGGDDAGDEEAEDGGRGGVPAETGVVGAHDALGEDHVDDEDEDAARLREDAGGHGDVGRARVRRPHDPHAQRRAPQHAQREQHAGEEELEAGPLVELEDRHVRRRRRHEEREEHGGHGDVGRHRRHAAHDGRRRGVGRAVMGGV